MFAAYWLFVIKLAANLDYGFTIGLYGGMVVLLFLRFRYLSIHANQRFKVTLKRRDLFQWRPLITVYEGSFEDARRINAQLFDAFNPDYEVMERVRTTLAETGKDRHEDRPTIGG